MNSPCDTDEVINVLWDSLAGSNTELMELRSKVHDGADFKELGLDSLDALDYYLRLQDAFDVDITSDDFFRLTSFSEIAAYINSRKESKD